MKTKHTSGAWKITTGLGPAQIQNRVVAKKFIISECPWGIGSHTPEEYEEVEANTKLIAAAPELLEACKEAVSTIEMLMGDELNPSASMSLSSILKAIKRATE